MLYQYLSPAALDARLLYALKNVVDVDHAGKLSELPRWWAVAVMRAERPQRGWTRRNR